MHTLQMHGMCAPSLTRQLCFLVFAFHLADAPITVGWDSLSLAFFWSRRFILLTSLCLPSSSPSCLHFQTQTQSLLFTVSLSLCQAKRLWKLSKKAQGLAPHPQKWPQNFPSRATLQQLSCWGGIMIWESSCCLAGLYSQLTSGEELSVLLS